MSTRRITPDTPTTTTQPASHDSIARLLGVIRSDRRALPIVPAKGVLRVGFYARYSSHRQDDSWSIEAQHEAAEREAATRAARGEHWQLVFYDEPARSAREEKLAKRVVFLQLLADAIDGRVDVVCVGRLDRLSRALKVQLLVIDELQRAGVGFASLKEGMSYTTATERLFMQQMGAFAEFASTSMGELMKDGKRQRARQGLQSAHPAFGYRVDEPKAGAVPDTSGMWDGLQELFHLSLSGMSDRDVAHRMNADGRWWLSSATSAKTAEGTMDDHRRFTANGVSRIRKNVFYRPFQPGDDRGTIVLAGVTYRGAHVAACSWDDWHAMQTMARDRRRGWDNRTPVGQPYSAEFRGLAACAACGKRLYVSRLGRHWNTPQQICYERYICDPKSECEHAAWYAFTEHVRDAWIEWATDNLQLPGDWETRVRRYAIETTRSEAREDETSEALARQLTHWQERRRRAVAAYLDGDIGESEYEARIREADAQIARLTASLRSEPERTEHTTHLLDAGRLVVQIADLWPDMTTDERIAVATKLIEPNGLAIALHGHGRMQTMYQRRAGDDHPGRCELVGVRLRAPYQELLTATGIEKAAG